MSAPGSCSAVTNTISNNTGFLRCNRCNANGELCSSRSAPLRSSYEERRSVVLVLIKLLMALSCCKGVGGSLFFLLLAICFLLEYVLINLSGLGSL